ncbi:MAG TPA: YraN family protein [Kofleriaceae bacterium]|nr:YraN family protein [Kofleriaceae bacterium]
MSTREAGARGEDRAARALTERGYRIVERNFRCRAGEIDIIARDGEVLVFVEVRSRSGGRYGTALETISRAKQRQVAKVAGAYLAARRLAPAACRFDVVGITGDELVIVADAFRVGIGVG